MPKAVLAVRRSLIWGTFILVLTTIFNAALYIAFAKWLGDNLDFPAILNYVSYQWAGTSLLLGILLFPIMAVWRTVYPAADIGKWINGEMDEEFLNIIEQSRSLGPRSRRYWKAVFLPAILLPVSV